MHPTGPGTSTPLAYPVLLFTERDLAVRPDEERLTTTTTATGMNYTEYTLLDSNGAQYSIRKVTDFDNNSGFFNMGTASYRVHLHLKSEGKPGLDKAKATLKAVARRHPQTENGIGGSLTTPPLPHHRTCGSASGGSAG